MAIIKLVFKPDYTEVNKAIAAIKADISKNIGNIKITIDSSGAQSVQKMATGLRDVATQAGRLDKEYGTLMRSTTTVDKATGDLIQKTREYQKTALTAFKTVEDAQGNVTESEIKNYKELDKIAQKQADDFVKLKRYVFEQYRKWDEEDAREAEAKRQKELEAERKATEEKNKLKLQMSRFNREQDEKDAAEAEKQAQRQAAAQKKAEDQVVSLRREYANFIRQIEILKAQYPEGTFDEIEKEAREAQRELQNLDSTSKTFVGDVDRLSSGLKKEKAQLAEVREETNKLDKVTESFWMNIQKFARWYIGGNIVTKVIGSLREALSTMKEVDTELANIQKVTDRTDQQMQRTAEAAYKVASAYGVAAQDYLESVAEFAKAGFGDQSEQLAEIATKTQLVGDVTSTIANKFLIASNAAWKMNGDIATLNKTLDAANIIENNYATSIEKLAAGMPIVSSIAAQAGMTFEQTIAALGTITAVTQETGTKAATALRALILNILGAVGEYEDGIEITEESVKSLDGILQVYAKDALAAADAAGTVVNPMEAIAALAKASEEGLVNQAELFDVLSSLGGKLRTNQLTALVQNFDMMQEMLDKTTQSAGSADREIGVMLDTWEAKTNILKNTWTEFIANTINSDLIKGILDISTAVVDFADNAGLAATAAAGLFTIFKGKEVIGALKDVRDTFKNLGDVLKGTTSNMTAATTSIGLMITAVSAFIMIYRQVEQARRESLEKAATEAASIQNLTDKYEDLTEKLGSENLSRDELITLLKKSTEKYDEEWESINDVNELREIAIGLINEETKAKAKQYTMDNQAAYRMSQNILSGDRKVNMDYGGINQQYTYEEAIAFYEKAINDAMKAEHMTNAQARALGVLTDEYKRLKKEYEEATTTVDAYETALSILDGTYQRVEESGSGVAGHTKELANELDNAAKTANALTEKLAATSAAANAYDTAISNVQTALKDFGANSIEVYNAMVKLEAEIPGSTAGLYDFHTATLLVDQSLFEDKESVLDLIDAMKQVDFSDAINEAERAAEAAWDMAEAWSAVLPMMGGVFQNAAMASSAYAGSVKAQRDEWDSRVANLRSRATYSTSSGTGRSSYTPVSSAPESTKDAELERLKAIISLEKSELSFLQASGKSLDEINAKRKVIQAALHDEAEYLRAQLEILKAEEVAEEDKAEHEAKIKALEEDILALSTEWWNIQKNINDDIAKAEEELRKAEEERLKAIEEENKKLEEQKKLQQEMFDNLKSIVDDYYAKLIEDKEKELTLEERILAVQQAEATLANAQRERTVRYYNAATGQWEWQANAKNVKSAQDALKKAQDDLNKYQREQAWKEFKSAWEYVTEQIKAGAMTFKEAYDYMYDAMTRIQDTYGVDLGYVLEDSIGGFKDLNYGIDGLTQEVANSLGASVGVLDEKLKQYETAVGAFKDAFDEASEKIKNGEWTMEDAYSYLRDRAKEIADKYGIDMTGALEEAIAGMDKTNMSIDELWKAVIINLMKVNSARWFDANDEERAMLHAQNEYLGRLIGATYDPSGYWYLNGSQLYGSQKGVDYSGKTSGWGNFTGSGGGYGGGGGGWSGGSGTGGGGSGGVFGGVSAIRGAGGTGIYYDSYGNTYSTLEAAIKGNASLSQSGSTKGMYYGKAFETIYNNQMRWKDPELWAEYSRLMEADPEYAAKLMELEAMVANGAPQEDITALINSLYAGDGGTFGSINNGDTTTGWVKAAYGNANGEHLLMLNGQLYNSQVKAGTMLQDLWGRRWIVGEDGHSLTPLLAAWDENGIAGYVYTASGVNNGQPVLNAEDVAAGEEWAAMMDLNNSDMGYAGAVVDSPDVPASAGAVTTNTTNNTSGDTYNINGIRISESDANRLTVADLARLAGGLGQYKGAV